MGTKTGIEWADSTLNIASGCLRVSPGCDNCYAETFTERFRGTPGHYFEAGFDFQLHEDKLHLPFRWTNGRRIFVNSLSDLWISEMPREVIAELWAVAALTARHTYMILTKRPARMRATLASESFRDEVAARVDELSKSPGAQKPEELWPLPNVWCGVSAEDQERAALRIPVLLQTEAQVLFVSAEPMLGPLELGEWLSPAAKAGVDWVICGGESGPNWRPMDLDWARRLRDDCVRSGTSFFFKQHAGRVPKLLGRELDGRTWDEIPA